MTIPAKIVETKTYTVKLARTVTYGRHVYKPLNEMEMSGKFLKAIIAAEGEEAIDYARAV